MLSTSTASSEHDHVADERTLHRHQRTDRRQERTRSGHDPHEPAFLHHQHDRAALGVQQFGGGLRHLAIQRREVVAAEQRRGEIAQPVEFAVAPRRRPRAPVRANPSGAAAYSRSRRRMSRVTKLDSAADRQAQVAMTRMRSGRRTARTAPA